MNRIFGPCLVTSLITGSLGIMGNSPDYAASFSRTAPRGGSDGAVNATNPEGRTSSKTAPPRLEGGADEDEDDTALFKVCPRRKPASLHAHFFCFDHPGGC